MRAYLALELTVTKMISSIPTTLEYGQLEQCNKSGNWTPWNAWNWELRPTAVEKGPDGVNDPEQTSEELRETLLSFLCSDV